MKTMEESSHDSPTERPNKSALKRESAKLRELGETLLALNSRQLDSIPLPLEILKALAETRRLKHRDARRRQLQFIAKLLRKANLDDIRAALTEQENSNRFFHQRQKRLEGLVENLVSQGDEAFNRLLSEHPGLDRQHLRQLIRRAQNPKPGTSADNIGEPNPELSELGGHNKGQVTSKTDPARRKLFLYLTENLP